MTNTDLSNHAAASPTNSEAVRSGDWLGDNGQEPSAARTSDAVRSGVGGAEEPMHEKIFRVSLEWCQKHTEWKRICDIPNSDALYKTWDEMPKKARALWERQYGEYSAESAWREFGRAVCKVPYGFIGTNGAFYPEITDVPLNLNSCMVFRVGGGGAEQAANNGTCETKNGALSPSDQAQRRGGTDL